jgi:predicted ester cyclase
MLESFGLGDVVSRTASTCSRFLFRALFDTTRKSLASGSSRYVLHTDFAFRGSLGTQTRGREEWRTYRDQIRAGSGDFHNEVLTLVADGDRAAARLRYSGTHDGPLAGVAPTGRRFVYSGAAFFTARDGKLETAWVLGDLTALLG